MNLKTELNPDEDFVRDIRKQIKSNGGYCISNFQKSNDTKCMCREFREQTTEGFCSCALYRKVFEEEKE